MSHPIKNIHIRNFRSLEKTSVTNCGGLNVLIGKNNAGKSSVLAVIPMLINHLAEGRISTSWSATRASEQFTNKDIARPLQIAIEFELLPALASNLFTELLKSAPQLGKSIEQLKDHTSVTFIIRFCYKASGSYQYIESVCFGPIDADQDQLLANGDFLLITPTAAAAELFQKYQHVVSLNSKVEVIKKIVEGDSFPLGMHFRDKKSYPGRFIVERNLASDLSTEARKDIADLLENSESEEAFKAKAAAVMSQALEDIDEIAKSEISTPLQAYSGDVKLQPSYITDLCLALGAIKILTLGERKQPIGRKEASRLLQLKVRRGGPEQLQIVQQTVKALLGVSLDAFQGEGGREVAEMDVDNFLAEANGAGIRESLRMILDLELEPSDLVLIEEPEVHLHPALEFAIHGYLQEKRKTKQFFLTTHSTNFVDAMASQHIYLVARHPAGISSCQNLSVEEAPMKLPAELGIRLSTVFMFDKIVFVEGSSDEAVLRELARTLKINIQGAGVAFVHMGGIANFTHYAAQGTLDILTRRRVKMWFVVDKDERDDLEVKSMMSRLGNSATLCVLEKRELENFLVDENAIICFVREKTGKLVTHDEYILAVEGVAIALQEKVVQMYMEKNLLHPIYLRGKDASGSIEDRLSKAQASLQQRIESLPQIKNQLESTLLKGWNSSVAIKMAPGEMLLDAICQKLGCAFNKSRGDSIKLAKHMKPESISDHLKNILQGFSSTDANPY